MSSTSSGHEQSPNALCTLQSPQGKEKVRKLSLNDCRVKYRDPTEKMSDKAFVIADSLGKHSKFSAKTPSVAQAWVDKIRLVIAQEEERRRHEVLLHT